MGFPERKTFCTSAYCKTKIYTRYQVTYHRIEVWNVARVSGSGASCHSHQSVCRRYWRTSPPFEKMPRIPCVPPKPRQSFSCPRPHLPVPIFPARDGGGEVSVSVEALPLPVGGHTKIVPKISSLGRNAGFEWRARSFI